MACTSLIRGSLLRETPAKLTASVPVPLLSILLSRARSFLISIYPPLNCFQLSCSFLFSISFPVCLLMATEQLVTALLHSHGFSPSQLAVVRLCFPNCSLSPQYQPLSTSFVTADIGISLVSSSPLPQSSRNLSRRAQDEISPSEFVHAG